MHVLSSHDPIQCLWGSGPVMSIHEDEPMASYIIGWPAAFLWVSFCSGQWGGTKSGRNTTPELREWNTTYNTHQTYLSKRFSTTRLVSAVTGQLALILAPKNRDYNHHMSRALCTTPPRRNQPTFPIHLVPRTREWQLNKYTARKENAMFAGVVTQAFLFIHISARGHYRNLRAKHFEQVGKTPLGRAMQTVQDM